MSDYRTYNQRLTINRPVFTQGEGGQLLESDPEAMTTVWGKITKIKLEEKEGIALYQQATHKLEWRKDVEISPDYFVTHGDDRFDFVDIAETDDYRPRYLVLAVQQVQLAPEVTDG